MSLTPGTTQINHKARCNTIPEVHRLIYLRSIELTDEKHCCRVILTDGDGLLLRTCHYRNQLPCGTGKTHNVHVEVVLRPAPGSRWLYLATG